MSGETEREQVERIIYEELTRGYQTFTTNWPHWITLAADRIIKERSQ